MAALAAGLALHAAGLVPSLADQTLLEVVAEATLAFVYVGAALLPGALPLFGEPAVLAAVLGSLLVVRPLAVFLSLAGTAATWRERLLLGWFGPRGLATALFAVLTLAQFELLTMREPMLAIAALAVALSAVLHGVSAHFAGVLAGGKS